MLITINLGRYDRFHHIALNYFCCEERPHSNVVILLRETKERRYEKEQFKPRLAECRTAESM